MSEARRRAPRRDGQRTTLRVPPRVMDAAERLASQLGTTPNDALIQLAEAGANATERRRQLEAIAAERRAAVARVGVADALSFPDPDTLRAAMLAGRDTP